MEENQLFERVNEITPELAFLEGEIARIKKELKELEERKSELSQVCIEAFEETSTGTYENEKLKITYVKPSVRCSLDTDKLKAEHPEIAKECQKETSVKASIRIKLKENE